MRQGPPIFTAGHERRSRGFTIVEIMVVVVIIGLLAAMSLPIYRHLTMRSRMVAVQNDLRTFSTALVTYNLQHGAWPADASPGVIPAEMSGALPPGFMTKTPIGGLYKWEFDNSSAGFPIKAGLSIISVSGNPMTEDIDQLELIDREMDDGNLSTGIVRLGSTNALVYIIEQ